MTDQFVGEIRPFAGNFAPVGWALCNGQLMPINQNTALFSLLGVNFGGDGKTTFALPDLRARVPLGSGQGPGLSPRPLGGSGGTATVTLQPAQMPAHAHVPQASQTSASTASPQGAVPALSNAKAYGLPNHLVALSGSSISPVGAGQPHNNLQPYLVLNFIIALQGIFPARP